MAKENSNNDTEMVQLNALVHPAVKREMEEQAKEYRKIDGSSITDRAFYSAKVSEMFKPRAEFENFGK